MPLLDFKKVIASYILLSGRLNETGHWQFFTRFYDERGTRFPLNSAWVYMLVERQPDMLPNATIVAKVTGSTNIPGTLSEFMPTMSTYGFTDMELLKNLNLPFAIISGQKDIELFDDASFRAEWIDGTKENGENDKKGVFHPGETKMVIPSGREKLLCQSFASFKVFCPHPS